MKYVGTLLMDIIVNKAINYTDYVAENEIELTEEQYNTIPIPCQCINGEFIECDFPVIEVEEEEIKIPVAPQIELVSYVGTGLYGEENPCSLTFDFVPTVLKMLGFKNTLDSSSFAEEFFCTLANSDVDALDFIICDELSTEYECYRGFCVGHNDGTHLYLCKKSEDGKTISWYADRASYQCSVTGCTYYILAIGR